MIDTIPDIIWVALIVTMITGLCYVFIKVQDTLDPKDAVGMGLFIIVLVIGGTLWAAHLLKHIVTAFANPEYAAMIKFAVECVK
jgi:hypothetical protein